MHSHAFIPNLVSKTDHKTLSNLAAILGGVLLLALLAQITVPLPWTPVPITGQTFGVTLVSLLWGWKRAGTVLLTYLALGASGLVSVFAVGAVMGPTLGYLIGMFLASVVMGALADRGVTNTFLKTFLVSYLGSAIVFVCGLIGLSFFLPSEALIVSGLIPFLPGSFIKNFLASALVFKSGK